MNAERAVPDNLARTLIELHGDQGVAWLAGLPALIAHCAQRWSLTVLPPFEPLSYNYVAPAVRADGTEAVLKLGVPNPELLTEIEALRIFDGHGAVRLLGADAEQGILLLEQLRPGDPLTTVADDDEATRIAAEVMRRLWRPVPAEHPFPTVARWVLGFDRMRQRFDGGTGPLPPALVDQAERLFADLLATADEPVLLHGDLHHGNIRRAQRQPWLVIDPKGVVGEPAYEVGALLRNPFPQLLDEPDLGRLIARRADILAQELGFDRTRLLQWGLAQAVLSAWWNVEDHGWGWEWAIRCAEVIDEAMGR